MNKQSIRKSLQTVETEMSSYPQVVKEEYDRCISKLANLCLGNIDDQIAGAMDDVVNEAFSNHDRSEIEYAFNEVKALYEHATTLHNLAFEKKSNLKTIIARLITEKNEGN